MGKKKSAKFLNDYFSHKHNEFEKLCNRCGACCGSYDGDPCTHLRKDKNGKYYCNIYPDRLGKRKTVSGEEFECVPISEIIEESWAQDYRCTYKKLIGPRLKI